MTKYYNIPTLRQASPQAFIVIAQQPGALAALKAMACLDKMAAFQFELGKGQ